MVVERSHQAKAFSAMPFMWNAGNIIGPLVGGAYFPFWEPNWISSLADPARQYPGFFSQSRFFTRFPYALPNLVIASFLLACCFLGFLSIRETLDSKRNERDIGIRFRLFTHRLFHRIISRERFPDRRTHGFSLPSEASEADTQPFLESLYGQRREEAILLSPMPIRRSHPGHPYRRLSNSFPPADRADGSQDPRFGDIFTQQIILNIAVYSGLMLQSVSFDQVFPLLCSTNVEDGGMGMTAGQIGMAICVAGVVAMVLQVTIFPWGHNKFGRIVCFRVVLAIFPMLYFVPTPPCSIVLTVVCPLPAEIN